MRVTSVDRFGPTIGFVHCNAEVETKATGKIPGSFAFHFCFLFLFFKTFSLLSFAKALYLFEESQLPFFLFMWILMMLRRSTPFVSVNLVLRQVFFRIMHAHIYMPPTHSYFYLSTNKNKTKETLLSLKFLLGW